LPKKTTIADTLLGLDFPYVKVFAEYDQHGWDILRTPFYDLTLK
jgi:hypothetical protein